MLRKEAKGSENDAEFCEKICEIFAKQKLRNFAKTFFLTFSFVFRSFLYERNAKNAKPNSSNTTDLPVVSRIPGKKEEYYIFEITLGPFITLSFRNGHKLKD